MSANKQINRMTMSYKLFKLFAWFILNYLICVEILELIFNCDTFHLNSSYSCDSLKLKT